MKYVYVMIVLCCLSIKVFGQHAYGTTGLLHAPTAEMQRDKTVMIGGSMIDHNIYRDSYWNAHDEYKPYTFNYYLNVTIFPWLEVAYTCTLVKGIHGSSYWPQETWGKVCQPRRFLSFPTESMERRLVEVVDTTNRVGRKRSRQPRKCGRWKPHFPRCR